MRTWLRGKFTLLFMTCAVALAIPAVALADQIGNNVDATIDATVEQTSVQLGGPAGSDTKQVGYLVSPQNTATDGDAGCNLDGSSETLVADVVSSNPSVATVSPSQVEFSGPGCGATPSVTVKGVSAGTTQITLTQFSNNTGGTFDLTTATFQVNVLPPPDSTPPVITKTVTGTLNNGWYTSNVGVDWTVSDAQSAISSQSGCTDFSVTSDQQATTYTCTATSAGGTSSDSVTIKRDATQPTNVQFVGGPAASGSYTFGNVPNEPTCTADDATSTVDTCVVSGYSNAVGEQTLTATATDKAGNKTTATRTYTVNKADPTITWDAPVAINYGTALNATQLNATANVAGTFTYTPPAGTVLNAGTHTLSVQFTPNDTTNYNSVSKTVSLTVNKANATIDVDGFSGTYDGNAHGATGTATGVNNENLSNLLDLGGSFTDVPGGTANWTFEGNTNYNSDSGTAAIVINKASSTTTVTCPANVTYTGSALTPCTANVTGAGGLNQSLTVSYTNNTDSGTATASASFAGDANHTGSSSGSKNFNINFNFTGFASPVDNNNVLNTAKAGQAIPLKWRLTDASGNPVTNLLSTDVKVTATSLSCALGTTTDLVEEYATGSSGLQNLGNGYYQFNWSTPKSYASSCKTMTLTLGEGTTTHTALFQFTR